MPPKGLKRKSGEEEARAKANTMPTVSSNSRGTFLSQARRRKKNPDAEDGDEAEEVSARDIYPSSIRTAYTDNSIIGRRTGSQ
jgi:hypothetical protein